jgi:ectoine hydroxylase-related dioxygenase (phytanoyl-CoA dioxygenase family)
MSTFPLMKNGRYEKIKVHLHTTSWTKMQQELKRFDGNTRNFVEWSEFFDRNGFVIIDNAMHRATVQQIQRDLRGLNNSNNKKNNRNRYKKGNLRHRVHKRFFLNSVGTRDFIQQSVVTDFSRYLIRHNVPCSRPGSNSLAAHVMHCNSFSVPSKGRGQAPSWHMDDPCHNIVMMDDKKELPDYVQLPVNACTWMIWLSDCPTPRHGPTHIIPGSHRFGRECTNEAASRYKRQVIAACGRAGTAVLVNSQTWHRGCENQSNVARDTLQISFARRLVGHKFGSIMNYSYPRWFTDWVMQQDKQTQQLFGFLQGGAYS